MREELNRSTLIFAVDDDEDDLYFIKSSILNIIPGSEVKCFIHGRQVMEELNKISGAQPSFILLDLNMPVLNGRETLKLIKENDLLKAIPVIIFSTSNNPNEKSFCLKNGANDYFCKPSSLSVYDDIIRKLKAEYIDRISAVS